MCSIQNIYQCYFVAKWEEHLCISYYPPPGHPPHGDFCYRPLHGGPGGILILILCGFVACTANKSVSCCILCYSLFSCFFPVIFSIRGRESKYIHLVHLFVYFVCPYMVKTLKNLFLRNQKAYDLETRYVASGARVLPSLFKG